MMKNDLDFIKNKIENSGVCAPEDMNEAYVLSELAHTAPDLSAVQPEPKRKSRGWAIGISATAASLVLVMTLGIVLHSAFGKGGVRSIGLPGGLALKQFQSRDQVTQEVSRIRRENQRGSFLDYFAGKFRLDGDMDYIVDDAAGSSEENGSFAPNAATGSSSGSSKTGGAAGSQSHSETYEQVEGVSEADIIKTDGKYIYCVDNNHMGKIAVFSAEGEDSERVTTIDIKSQKAATEDEADFDYESYYGYGPDVDEIYLSDDRLIVLYSEWTGEGFCQRTSVQVYDISDVDHITLLDSMSQSGGCRSSRMIGDTLYLVSSYYPYENRILPVCGNSDSPDEIPADCIYTLADNHSDSFLVISAYDTRDYSAQTESKSILGGVEDIYCNENHLYIYTTIWSDSWYTDGAYEGAYGGAKSQILKVDLTDGLSFTAYTEVDGAIDDQYALDEYDGNLRVATTSFTGVRDTNNLFVLDESLNEIGSVTGFAQDESIKAVRYMGDTAYVITYEETDPLFVIDLSNPTAPEILGEVKISGFSTMLVPIGEDKLLGIGYHTENESYTTMEVQEGLKLALFDVSDKAHPQVLDSKSYVNCSSEVQYNPKALVYNPERDDFIIPLNYANWGRYDSELRQYVYEDEYYGGVLNFAVEGDRLIEIDRCNMMDCDAVHRCVYVGDTVYMTYYDDYVLMIASVPYTNFQ